MTQAIAPLSTTMPYDEWSDAVDDERGRAEWRAFWLLVIPQLLIAAATLGAGLPGVFLLVACAPLLVATLLNPFYGIAALFSILVIDEMLGVFGTKFSLSKSIGIFVLVGFALRASRTGYSLLPVEPVSRLAVAWAGFMMLSSIWATYPLATLIGSTSPCLLAGLVVIGVQLINSRHRLEMVLTAMMIGGLIASVLLTLGVGGFTRTVGGGAERAALMNSNANLTGRILVVSIVAAVSILIYCPRRFLKLLAPFAVMFMILAVLKTKSRESTVSIGWSLSVGTLLGLRAAMGHKLVVLGVCSIVVVGMVILGGAIGLLPMDTIFDRWEGGVEGLTKSRTYLLETGLGIWTESVMNMAVGTGHGMFHHVYTEEAGREQRFGGGLGRDAHNQWVKSLCELGVVGLAIFGSLAIMLVLTARKTAPGYAFMSWGIVAALSLASVKSSMDYVKVSWYSMMLVAAIARIFPRQPKTHTGNDPILTEYWRLQSAR